MDDITPPSGYHWMRSRCRNCDKDGLRHFGPLKSADKNIQKYVVCEYCGAESRKSETLIGSTIWNKIGGGDDPFFYWIFVFLTLGMYYLLDLIFRRILKLIMFFIYGPLDTPYVLVRRWWK